MQELTQERTKERWMELCEQAAVESDSQKLMALISEINRMLDSKMEERHEPAPALASADELTAT